MNKKIKLGQFFTPKAVVDIAWKMIKRNKVEFDFVADTSGGNGDFITDEVADKFIYVDIDKYYYDYVKDNYKILKTLNKNSLNDLKRSDICTNDKKLLIVGNPPYNNWTSFYMKNQKGSMLINDTFKARDMGISFLKMFNHLDAEYICVLHPLSYLIKKSNFNQLGQFKNNYVLTDGIIISSNLFNDTSKNTQFPIIIALYKKDSKGMSFDEIKTFTFSVHNSNYKFCLNQFLYIEDVHTKYKDKSITGNYAHFSTLRDMNQLVINKGFLEQENAQSIRVKGRTALKIFKYLQILKSWYSKNKNEFYFLGNFSPIVNKEIWKNIDTKGEKSIYQEIDLFFKKELSENNSILSIYTDKLIWNFTNISPSGKYRFKKREKHFEQGEIKPSASQVITDKDFLEIQIGYDKKVEDFYSKPSLYKLAFKNNKDEDKYIFELSDIFYWGLNKGFIDLEFLTNLLNKVESIKTYIEDEYKITRKQRVENPKIILPISFQTVDVIKPSFISEYIDNDFIEIKIDYKQKAIGTQAMLFLNLSAKNFVINNEPIIGKTISKTSVINYVIDRKRYTDLFIHIILLFANLSKEHNTDIIRILSSVLKYKQNELYENVAS
ncbi:R.Pab1 family restriction endonuclease [Mycoplasma sp. 394]